MFLKKQFNIVEAAIIAAGSDPQPIVEAVQWMHAVRSRGNQPGNLNPTVLAVWDDAKRNMHRLVDSIEREEISAVESPLSPAYWNDEIGLRWYEGISIDALRKWCDVHDGIPPFLQTSEKAATEKGLLAKERENLHVVIGALLAVLEGKWGHCAVASSRAEIIRVIVDNTDGVSGLSQSNLNRVFAEGGRALQGRTR